MWSGEGTDVTETGETQTSVTFTVDAVGEDPRVALSRLPFPGYSVSGAELADPVRDYLLTVDVAGLEAGDQVTVRFLPPPFPVLAGSFVLAWLAAGRLAHRARGGAAARAGVTPSQGQRRGPCSATEKAYSGRACTSS